jgi:hypothetical protein
MTICRQHKEKASYVLTFSFLLDGKGSDEARTTHASAVHKGTTFSKQDAKSRATRRVTLLIFSRGVLHLGPATGVMRLHLNLMEIALPKDGR